MTEGADIDILVEAIEEVKDRIKHYHTTIGSNETRTRNDLIDPLLGALGWDDPSVNTREYLIRYGDGERDYLVADYALHLPGQLPWPIVIIEAKRMDEDIADEHFQREHRRRALLYASVRKSVEYIGLTNGDRWIFYKRGVDRPVLKVSIRSESARSCADKLLKFKRSRNTTAVITVEGRVDGANARDFQVALEEAIEGSETAVILDLELLSYIASAGLRVILLMAKTLRTQNADFAVCSLSESIREIFAISGFDKIVDIHSSKDEALAALGS